MTRNNNFKIETVLDLNISIQHLTDSKAFGELRQEWDELYQSCTDVSLFNSWEWASSWWTAYSAERELCLLTFRQAANNDLVAIVPLYVDIERVWPGFNYRVLRLIGDKSYDSDYLNVLLKPEYIEPVMNEFSNWLQTNKEWHMLTLNTVSESALSLPFWEQMRTREKMLLRIDRLNSSQSILPESFQEFLATLKPRFRTKIRSLLRTFDENDDIVLLCDNSQLDERLQSLYDLHQARWTEIGQAGVFGQSDKQSFYNHFVPLFAERDWLRLYSLKNGNQFVAHQLCFGVGGTTYLLQEGFDTSDKKASFGQMLRGLIFRTLIEQNEKVYDFLGGTSTHKSNWGAETSEMVNLTIAKKNWRGLYYFKKTEWREKLALHLKPLLNKMSISKG